MSLKSVFELSAAQARAEVIRSGIQEKTAGEFKKLKIARAISLLTKHIIDSGQDPETFQFDVDKPLSAEQLAVLESSKSKTAKGKSDSDIETSSSGDSSDDDTKDKDKKVVEKVASSHGDLINQLASSLKTHTRPKTDLEPPAPTPFLQNFQSLLNPKPVVQTSSSTPLMDQEESELRRLQKEVNDKILQKETLRKNQEAQRLQSLQQQQSFQQPQDVMEALRQLLVPLLTGQTPPVQAAPPSQNSMRGGLVLHDGSQLVTDNEGKVIGVCKKDGVFVPAQSRQRIRSNSESALQGSEKTAGILGSTFDIVKDSNPGAEVYVNRENGDILNVSIPPFLYQKQVVRETTLARSKILSGKYESGNSEVLHRTLWPHHALDNVLRYEEVEYDNLSYEEFCAGFVAKVLVEAKPGELSHEVTNKLRHLNRVLTYGFFASKQSVLLFNEIFMKGIENKTNRWDSWEGVSRFHESHLNSLQFSKFFQSGKPDGTAGKQSDEKLSEKPGEKKDLKKKSCDHNWVRSHGLCFKFQNGTCSEQASHKDQKGNAAAHHCAWCLFTRSSVKDHPNATCPDKENPFRSAPSTQKGKGGE